VLVHLITASPAEVLLQFYEDLVERGAAEPLPDLPWRLWHPLFDRISDRGGRDLDGELVHLGVSPHPGVVLVIEGETEDCLIPRIFDHLGLRRTPDLIHVLCLSGLRQATSARGRSHSRTIIGSRRATATT